MAKETDAGVEDSEDKSSQAAEEEKAPAANMAATSPQQLGWKRMQYDFRGMMNRNGLKRLGVLTWTVIACVVSYSTYAFVVYLPALRDRFGMSQSQAEFAMSLTWLGMGSPIFLGFLINRWGPRVGALVALVLSAGAYMLLYSACVQAHWYTEHVYLVALYCFLGGTGSGATSIAGISAAMSNFTETYRGTIMMFLTSGTALGALIFKAIYNNMFVRGYDNSPEKQDLGDYFIVVGFVFLAVNLGGIFVYGCYLKSPLDPDEKARLISGTQGAKYCDESPTEETETDDGKEDKESTSSSEPPSDNGACSPESQYYPENQSLTLAQTLCHPMFHFLAWPCIITQGLYSMTVNNVVVFLESFGMMQFRISLPYAADIAQMVSRPIVGFSSDLVQHRVSRAWFIMVGLVIDLVIFSFDIAYLNSIEILFINVIVLGYACVATFTMTPSLICDEFGVTRFPRNWGMVQGGNCVAMFLFCNLVSLFYQYYSDESTGLCSALICYSWTYAIASFFALFCLILMALYLYRKRRGRVR